MIGQMVLHRDVSTKPHTYIIGTVTGQNGKYWVVEWMFENSRVERSTHTTSELQPKIRNWERYKSKVQKESC